MGLFQAKTLHSLNHVLKIVLKLTKKSASSFAQLQNALIFFFFFFFFRECRVIKLDNVCNGNPTGNCHHFFFWTRSELLRLFSGHTP